MREVHSESIGQACFAGCGQPQRATVALPHQPTQIQTATPDLRAHKTRNVISALAPIETGSTEDSFAARVQIRAEPGQKAHTRIRHLAAVLAENNVAIGDEQIGRAQSEL